MKKIKRVTLWLSIFFLSGCGGVSNCNDRSTKKTVQGIIQSTLSSSLWYREMKFDEDISDIEISNIETTSHDNNSRRKSCSAQYSFSYKGEQYVADFTYNLSYQKNKRTTKVSVEANDVVTKYLSIAMQKALSM